MTFFWVLSDFISGRTNSFSLSPDLIQGSSEDRLVEMASGGDLAVSDAALWMLLLLRLAAVTTDERLELRNSTILSFCAMQCADLFRCNTNTAPDI